MTTPRQFSKTALGLPAVTEDATADGLTYSVSGKVFARLAPGGLALVEVTGPARERFLGKFAMRENGSALELQVADINGMHLHSVLKHAWLSQASEELRSEFEAASQAPSAGHELPASIGKPATRALLRAGIKSLDDVAERTEAELLDLHGVGPKAIIILAEALIKDGKTFRKAQLQ